MDIRRFLVPEKPSDGRARTDKAPAKVERKKPSSKRRRIALMSDSDEDEDFASTKKKEKTQEGMGIKGKIKDEPNDKDGRPAKIASVLSKKGSDPTGGKRIVMSAEDFFSSQAKPAKSTPPVEPTKPQTPGTSRIKMRLETFKRQDRNKEVEKVKPQTEDDHSPSKRHKKVSESRQKPPVVVEAVKPVIETKEVEEKEEGISTVIPSPKRSLSDSSGVKDRGSPVKPGMKKSTSDSSRKSYKDFLQRQGPTQLGTKQLPEAGENCLEGQTFVVTGVLESFERDDIIDYIKRYGGKISQQVGKRTSYCIVGRDAGPAKLEKIKQFNTKSLNEDEFLSLMQSLPSKQTKYFSTPTKQLKPPSTADKTTKKTKKTPKKNENQTKTTKPVPEVVPVPVPDVSPVSSSSTLHMECVTWADKYRPKSTKEIIGQQGEKSNVKKLGQWLENWHQQQNKGKTGGGGRKDGGSMFKAALLSGPPGVGKTTSASLVCQEKGFTYIELNASDTRNKSTLQETVKDALGIYDIASIVKGDHSGKNQALIMDEVDGMSGNEDRGGIQELISLIKSTQIPIICICNDRNHPKIRSLANHCFDLRFQRPRIEQIKGAIMKIAFKENVNVKAPAIEQIAVAANGDIRQTLHHLYMWSASGKTLSYDEAKDHSNSARKQLNLTPFEAVKKVFAPDTQRLSLIDQSELFFQDYSMMPLFVQENYLSVTPMNARDDPHKALQLFSKAAESLSWFDVTDHTIRTSGDWGLLPLQAVLSCSVPAFHLHGSLPHMVSFPQWLGRNSKQGRLSRILCELSLHTHTKSFASPMAVNQEYVPALRQKLTYPLIREGLDGVKDVVSLMESYCLTRDDWESILELGQFLGRPDLSPKIDSKVKSAFTRAYNKSLILSPFVTSSTARKAGRQGVSLSDDTEAIEGAVDVLSEDEDDFSSDAMIKAKKSGTKERSGNGVEGGKGKELGKGRGRGKGKASS